MNRLAVKVDVDTERGTRRGVPELLRLFDAENVRATFLFSLGPDNTGRALRRVFRPGFFAKVQRTSVVGTYGLRTLLNGVLWPGPHIGRRHASLLRQVAAAGHEVGIHCYDHVRWQDKLASMSRDETAREFGRACQVFEDVFGRPALVAGAAGWQANAHSLGVYADAGIRYASDTRGRSAFYPRAGDTTFPSLQLPTTLPTLDELLGRPEYPQTQLEAHYRAWAADGDQVLTIHAELEGMRHREWFGRLLGRLRTEVCFETLGEAGARAHAAPVCELVQGTVPGRSGLLAMQGPAVPDTRLN